MKVQPQLQPCPEFDFLWHFISSCLTQVMPCFFILGFRPIECAGNLPFFFTSMFNAIPSKASVTNTELSKINFINI